jgi:RimJ/RimL family protein N-acetyltransferase
MFDLLVGQDFAIAAWTWQQFRLQPMYVDRAFGLVDDGDLIGSIIWRDYNGYNVEFCYYAKGALSVGLVRKMAQFALDVLRVERVTIKIRRNEKRMGKLLLRLGAKVEGTLRCFYGREDAPRNSAIQYVLFREVITRLAGPNYVRSKMH